MYIKPDIPAKRSVRYFYRKNKTKELRFSYHRGSIVRRGATGPNAHPEPARDLRPSVLAVQVAEHQPQCLRGQMPGAASPGWSLSRRHLCLQELVITPALVSSNLGQRNVLCISHPLTSAVPVLTTLVKRRHIVNRINIHGRSRRDADLITRSIVPGLDYPPLRANFRRNADITLLLKIIILIALARRY